MFALLLLLKVAFIGGAMLPTYTQMVYVDKFTPSLTPDGTIDNPFTSVHDAMNSILDATPSKRYDIVVGAGTYTESLLHLKANVFVVGASMYLTRLNLNWDIDDPSWYNPVAANDDRSGFQQVSLVGSTNNINWTTHQASAGKVYLGGVRMNNALTVVAYHPINQLVLENCLLFSDLVLTGTNTQFYGTQFVNGNHIQLLSTINCQTLLTTFGHGTDGTFSANWTIGDQAIQISLLDFAMQNNFVLSGASCSANVNRATLPGSSNIIITNGASLTIYN